MTASSSRSRAALGWMAARRDSDGSWRCYPYAFKHGHYAAEAIASRREIAKLLRDARALVKQVS